MEYEYPSAYALLIYSIGLASLFIAILHRINDLGLVKRETVMSPIVGIVEVKEKRLGALGECGIWCLITVWIFSSVYIVVKPWLKKGYCLHIDLFCWTVTAVASFSCCYLVYLWLHYRALGEKKQPKA